MKAYKQSTNGLIKLIFLATVILTFLSGCEQSEVDILKDKNNQLDLSLRILKNKNNELESSLKTLKDKDNESKLNSKALEDKNNESELTLKTLKDKNNESELTLKTLKDKNNESELTLKTLKDKNNESELTLKTLKDKNNELESNIKTLSHDLQFANKQNGKKKLDLMSEYTMQFKDEITQKIREEYEWVAMKNSSYISLVILIPLLFLYHGNWRKNKQLKEDSIDLINQLKVYKDDLEGKYNEKVLENKKEIDSYKQKIDEELNKENQEARNNRLKKEEKIKLSDRIVEIQNILIQSRVNASVNK